MSNARIGERGSVTLVVAASLGLAGVLAAFTADVARVSAARARAQAAADAAALAAAQEIFVPSGEEPADVAADYARRGGASLLSCDCGRDGSDAIVEVAVDVALPLLRQVRTVHAVARAVVDTPAGSSGLRPWFAARLSCLLRAAPGARIVSGFRTREEQERLHGERPDLAAPPGHSLHERGLAADLGFPSTAVRMLAHIRAVGCGLRFPIAREPWHVEPFGLPP